MKMYLHFTPGDNVLFGPWIPNTDRCRCGGSSLVWERWTLGNYSRLCYREPFGRLMMVVAISSHVQWL